MKKTIKNFFKILCILFMAGSLFTTPIYADQTNNTVVDKTTDHNGEIKIDSKNVQDLSYQEFLSLLKENKINTVYYSSKMEYFYIIVNDDLYYKSMNPDYENFKKELLEQGINVYPISKLQLKSTQSATNSKGTTIIISLFLGTISIVAIASVIKKGKEDNNINIINRKHKTTAVSDSSKDGQNQKIT